MGKKIILMHDWLMGMRGGERVLEVFAQLFPQAPLYTLFYQQGSSSSWIEQRPIYTSALNHLPGISKHYRKLLPFFPWAIDSMKITGPADLLISSSHCVIKGIKKPKNARHLCYIHSPMRYLYDQYDNYFGPQAPWHYRFGARMFRHYLQRWDQESNANVDQFIANSHFVKERVQRYYQREARVVYPFVDLDDFTNYQLALPPKKDYYLMVTAFAPNKRVDLAIAAFNSWGRPLKIIGSGQQERELKKQAKTNVEFLGNLPRHQVIKYLLQAQGLVFPGVEDFGITPLEALAAATPVIAYQAGGVLETLNSQVAQFFTLPTPESLLAALEEFAARQFDPQILIARAQDFSKEKFCRKILQEIERLC